MRHNMYRQRFRRGRQRRQTKVAGMPTPIGCHLCGGEAEFRKMQSRWHKGKYVCGKCGHEWFVPAEEVDAGRK